MNDLLAVMRRLRAPDGCAWDRAQTHESLRPYLLEEAAEAADAVGTPELPDELGDVLLQVAFHAVIAEEAGTFGYPDIERRIVDKLVRRHPHVFGDARGLDPEAVSAQWERIKAAERGGRERSVAERIPASLGALAREARTQHLLGDAPADPQAAARAALERGDTAALLAAAVALAGAGGEDAEALLRAHTRARLERAQQERTP